MEKSIRVRRADSADAGVLADIGAATFSETFAANNSAADMRAYLYAHFRPDVQAAELADPSVMYFVAEVDGEPAGYAKLHDATAPDFIQGPRPIEIERLYVSARFHHRGIGVALMNACLNAARSRRAGTVWLGVWEHNARAIAFYRRAGFIECGEHTFSLGSDAQRDLIMARALD